MIDSMLRYPEVMTDMILFSITMTPLEYMADIDLDTFVAANDEAQTGSISNDIRLAMETLPGWRMHTDNEMLIYDSQQLYVPSDCNCNI